MDEQPSPLQEIRGNLAALWGMWGSIELKTPITTLFVAQARDSLSPPA